MLTWVHRRKNFLDILFFRAFFVWYLFYEHFFQNLALFIRENKREKEKYIYK